ncbi:MAG: hypothetical protein KDB27_20080 [Planctomycetales bacterium]|nr:hypothetical protein [Planctomycetales bacterium]
MKMKQLFTIAAIALSYGTLNATSLLGQVRATQILPASPFPVAEEVVSAESEDAAVATLDGEANGPASSDEPAKPKSLKEVLAEKPSPPEPIDPATVLARKKAEEAAKKTRVAAIAKLQFDRRSSTALRMWGTPEKKDDDASEKDKNTNGQKEDSSASDAEQATKTPAQLLAEEMAAKQTVFTAGTTKLQKDVTLGNWEGVKAFIGSLEKDEAAKLYTQMITSLLRGPARTAASSSSSVANRNTRFREKNVFSLDDVFGIIRSSPGELKKSDVATVGGILGQALALGHDLNDLLVRFRNELKKSDDALLTKRQMALLLFASGKHMEAGEFLPTAEEAQKENDREGLNLLARYAMAQYSKEKKVEYLETAWAATQAALAVGEVDEAAKVEALSRAVELAPKIRDEFGGKWLDESFTSRIERGQEILSTIGVGTSLNMQTYPTDAKTRLRSLELQKTAVEALLNYAPEKAGEWTPQLQLLANNWLREAEFCYEQAQSTSIGSSLRRDAYGNYYYVNSSNYGFSTSTANRNGEPIEASDMIENRPTAQWLALLDDSIKPRFDYMFAQLYLKVNEEELAFPYIEKFAKQQPDTARDLAHEFLRVWTKNHDPNANRNRTNYYMFSYGYSRRSDQIPLTRSKQERNLTELAEWIRRLREIPINDLDEKLLADAFRKSHSSAEVYRLSAIESVFGSIDNLEAKTLAEMLQHMRGSLGGVWRDPALQKNNNTNRKKADMEAEVVRGYQVANEVVDKGLQKYPDDWRLMVAKASLMHDENDYRQSLKKSSEYAANRDAAMNLFKVAAEQYAATVPSLSEDEEVTDPYVLWYYASLGAVDLDKIDENSVPDLRQPAIIRQALEALPELAAERHMGMFANSLFTRMSSLKPEMKFRYLKTGFEIVGDHKSAYEAKKVYEYYNDLVTEIRVTAEIDGSSKVSHEKPFGVWVNIEHTKEIERESGGFSKYLQNQNNAYYSYNYGRPTENYRDKFQDAATQALAEHFEVLSITFNDPETKSSASKEYGWRYTPYAYLLLKPRGPEVDTVPPLQIDFDFLDTSGYAVIPVESSPISIDASGPPATRPYSDLKITQTLDERQAQDGKLVLEVKATSHGLVPELDEICDIDPAQFEIAGTEDQGLSVSRYDQETDDTAIVSERMWTVQLQAKEDLTDTPKSFTFPASKIEGTETLFQRYVDADLESVEASVDLEASYGEPQMATWPWLVGGGCVLLLFVGVMISLLRSPSAAMQTNALQIPDELTPFTVIGLLKQIHANNGMNAEKRRQLSESISRLEAHYFVQPSGEEPNLKRIAEDWLRQSA